MSDDIRVPFPYLVPGLAPYEKRVSLPERLAIDWFREPCCEIVHPHMEHACSRYGLEIGTDSFKAALSIYGPLYTVTTLMTKRHPIELLRRALPAIFRSSVFFGTFTFLYARFACFLMQLTGSRNYRFIFWLSPFLMSLLSINIEKSTRRRELAVYMANQTAETLFKMLLSRGWFTYTPFRTGKRALFAASVALLHLFYNWSAQDLAPSVHALLRVLAGTKCQNSAGDWIEKRVRLVTTPILRLAQKKRTENELNKSDEKRIGDNKPHFENHAPVISNSDLSTTGSDATATTLGDGETLVHPDGTVAIGTEHNVSSDETLPDAIENYVLSSYSKSRVMFTLNGFVRGFLIGYIVRAALAVGPKLFNPVAFVKNYRKILSRSFGRGSFDFGLFVSLMVGVPRLIKVILSKIFNKEHPLIDAVAGFIGGCAGSMLHSSTEVTLYIASKAAEAMVETGVRRGNLPRIPFFVEILYSFSTATLFYAGSLEPWTVRPSYRKFLAKGSGWHYGRFSESDGIRSIRESSGMNQLHRQYVAYKKES